MDPTTLTYSLVSNGYIEIQSVDEGLDGVTADVYIGVNSSVNLADFRYFIL